MCIWDVSVGIWSDIKHFSLPGGGVIDRCSKLVVYFLPMYTIHDIAILE